MPFTALHAPVAWTLHLSKPKHLDFLAISVGAVIPDIFEPLTMTIFREYYWSVRQMTHSIMGVVTLDLALALFALYLVVYPLVKRMRRKNKRLAKFAGRSMLQSRPTPVIVFSVIVGTMSHVLLDVLYHSNNPLFYPFGDVSLLSNLEALDVSRLIIDVLMIAAFLLILAKYYFIDLFSSENSRASRRSP